MSSSTLSSLNASLNKLNNCFLESHQRIKALHASAIERTTPVIIVNRDNLVVRYQGKRTERPYLPLHYHHLKTLAHLPCALYNMERIAEKEDCSSMKAHCLQQVQEVLASLKEEPDEHPLKPYCPLLQQVVEENKEPDVAKKMSSSSTLRLIEEAARCRLDHLHRVTKEIKKEVGEAAWQSVVVIVLGPQMPREGDIAMQYYARILNTLQTQASMCPMSRTIVEVKEPGPRLIYAESIESEEQALNLLTTHIADEDVGEALLKNRQAMHADVLAYAGARYLEQLDLEL